MPNFTYDDGTPAVDLDELLKEQRKPRGRRSVAVDAATTDAREQRIAKLEGHRNTWRRIAYRLADELAKHDASAAERLLTEPED
jgi:hypothetical protein